MASGYFRRKHGISRGSTLQRPAAESCPECHAPVTPWSTLTPPTWWCFTCKQEWREDEVVRSNRLSPPPPATSE